MKEIVLFLVGVLLMYIIYSVHLFINILREFINVQKEFEDSLIESRSIGEFELELLQRFPESEHDHILLVIHEFKKWYDLHYDKVED